MLNDAAAAAAAVRDGVKGWKPAQVRAAIRGALDGGHAPAVVAERIAELAADTDGTAFPTRLRPVLDADAAAAIAAARKAEQAKAAAAAPPPWAEGPFKYLDPDRERCRRHPGHPADNCGQCATDARVAAREAHLAAESPAPATGPLPAAEARAAAQAAAAAAKSTSRTRKATPARVPRQSTTVDPLAAAVAELDHTPEPAAAPAPEPVGAAA